MQPDSDDLRSRITSAWQEGNMAEVWSVLINEAQERCAKSLWSKYKSKLSYEDCEDCFGYGVEKLLDKSQSPQQIKNPYAYVWTCADNEAKDMIAERSHEVRFDPEWINSEADNALVITEVALEAETADTSSREIIKQVLALAVSWLHKKRQKLIRVLLANGVSISGELLAEQMGMTHVAVRSLKCRAFDDLRLLIPKAAVELGIDMSSIITPEPEILTPKPTELPTPEEDIEPIPPEET